MDRGVGWLVLRLYNFALFVFLVVPVLVVVFISFSNEAVVRFPPHSYSLRWFVHVFQYPAFVQGIETSLKLGVVATAGAIALAVPAGLALVRSSSPWAGVIEAFLLSPLSLPMIVLGVALLFLYTRVGLGFNFWGLAAAHIAIVIPYVLRTVSAVYAGLDRSVEEAAMVLGATNWQTMRAVTLPLVRPGVVAGAIFAFLVSFDNVPVSIFLTTPTDPTLPVAIISYLVYNFDPSIAALSTMELVLVTTALVVLDRIYGLARLTAVGGQ